MRREAQRGGCAPIPHLRAMGSVAGQTDSLGSVDATVLTMAARRRTATPKKPRAQRLGRIVCERSGRWWVASMPSFPGAYSQGKTQSEAYSNLLLAIRELVDAYFVMA